MVNFSSPEPPTCWSLELLQSLDWRVFEGLCGEIARRRGYDPLMNDPSAGPDGGIDLKLRKPGAAPSSGYTIAALCKQQNDLVGVEKVREFFGELKLREFEEGYFLTSKGFTEDARYEFDGREDLRLIDGERIVRRIEELGEEEAASLLATFVTEKEDWNVPTCYRCNVKLVERVTSPEKGSRAFWGCRNYRTRGCRTMQFIG